MNKQVEIKCDHCGKEYLVYLCRLRRRNKHKYCSNECYWLGKKGTVTGEETKRKLSKNMKRMWKDGILKRKFSNEHKEKLSLAHREKTTWNKGLKGYKAGKEHYNWKGGKSFEPYGLEFNNFLREKVRKMNDFACQECKYTEKQLGYKLSVHHIDYNKQNNYLNNLVPLCKSCHTKTNFSREDWTDYFRREL